MQLRWSRHPERMDDERLPKRLFYGDVATGSRRQGGQIRRYKDTLMSSLKRLQLNPTHWNELALDRPTWRRTVKTGAAIYEANRIAAAKVKREARKSQIRPTTAGYTTSSHPPSLIHQHTTSITTHSSNELAQRLDNLPIANAAATAAADENGSVEKCWDTIRSKALAAVGRAPRHIQPDVREGLPAKSLHGPPLRRREQSSILPLPEPCATGENTSEAPVEKSGKQRRPRPGQINVEESSEDRLKNLRSQSHHRRRQVQTRNTQISTVALVSAAAAATAATAASKRQRPIIANMSTIPTRILDANRTLWTPPIRRRHTDLSNQCLEHRPTPVEPASTAHIYSPHVSIWPQSRSRKPACVLYRWWLPVEVDKLPNAAAPAAAAAAAAAAAEAVDVAAENASVEDRWCQLRDTIQSTALAVLGRARRQHQDWFDDNDAAISNLLAERNHLHKAYVDHSTADNKAAFYRSRRHLQQRLREMQDAWTARKAEEIQGYADRNEWKNFFSALKAVYGPPTKGTAPLFSADGSTLLTEKTQILQRWAEHFRDVLNSPFVIADAAIDRLPQVETNVDLDLPPSLQETIGAVQQVSSGKAPGSDAIPAEVYKHGDPQLMDHLTALFQQMWHQGEIPQDFKDATIVHLYKRKGNRQICDNHRGISLLNIAGKIFARILLNCLNNRLEQSLLPESQWGFTSNRDYPQPQFINSCSPKTAP
ncbi:hypothetical protein SprV_1002883500 [Sparganum proliferum]